MITQTANKVFWTVALVAALVFCGLAYYLKFPDIRPMVDEKVPFVKQLTAPLIAKWDSAHAPQTDSAVPAATPGAQASASPGAAATTHLVDLVAAPAATPAEAAAPQATPQAVQTDSVNLAQLSQNRSEWPKVVNLKKETEFPAVLDGKVVGKVDVPVGTQATLYLVKDDKVELIYQGGGAVVPAVDTDLIERVAASRHAAAH